MAQRTSGESMKMFEDEVWTWRPEAGEHAALGKHPPTAERRDPL